MNGTLLVVCLVFVIFVLAIIYVNRNTTESFTPTTYYDALKNGASTTDKIGVLGSKTVGSKCFISDSKYKVIPNTYSSLTYGSNKYEYNCNVKNGPKYSIV
jgi:hypothetical protein